VEVILKKAAFCLLVLLSAVVVAEDGARLLIVSTDALYNSILPLAEWKQACGISTRVVKLSEIGTDTTAIKNFIINAWNTWTVKPENVILVGSPSNLLARAYRMSHNGYYYSDNVYGNVTGDYRVDIPVGRFPAKSTAQLDVMVAKTIAYEKNPVMTDTLWMRRLTSVCRDQGDDDAYTYWNDIRTAINLARVSGFVGFDSLASSRGHNQQNVVNSIDAGTGLVMYRGSATANWYAPFAVDPGATSNGSRLPVILSFTCATLTLAPGESMGGDAGAQSTLGVGSTFWFTARLQIGSPRPTPARSPIADTVEATLSRQYGGRRILLVELVANPMNRSVRSARHR